MNKKMVSLLLAAVLSAAALSGCGGGGASSGQPSTQSGGDQQASVLYHAYHSQPYVTLDPSSENSNGIMVLQNVYETLTRYNEETSKVEPLLAVSWEPNEDGTQWVFQLRDDVTFHDGSKMTAQTVVNSIQRTIDKGAGAAYIWDSVEAVEATGEYEVTFKLSYAAPIDLISSAAYAAYIMSDSVTGQETEWFNAGNDGGSGPYTIAQASGDTVVLKAYDGYRGGWQENQYKNVIIKEIAESSARRQLVETGEAQLASDFSSTDLAALRQETDKINIYECGTFTNSLLCLNTQSEPMNNADFRRAMAYAFPYEETINSVLDGSGTQSRGMIPSGLWGHDDSLPQYTTDLDKAKEYLDKSGISTDGMKLTMTYATGFDTYPNWGQLYQVNLKKLGIDLELRSMEWDAQWAQAQNNNPDERQDLFVFQWWPDYPSPAGWFDSLVHSEDKINYNLAYIKDSELDALIEEADKLAVTDRETAGQKYIEVQKRLIDECQYLFLYDTMHIYAVSPSISGIHENPAYATAIPYYNITRNA